MIFLRHTTPAVAKGVCYGATDLPLARGHLTEFAKTVSNLPQATRIISSPLQRCRFLADHVGACLGLGVEVNDDLREMDFGRWEMTPWDDVPRAELDAWAADFMRASPHGGESVSRLQARVAAAIEDIEPTTLVVTHSGVIRAAAALRDHADGWNIDVKFGGWVRL